MAGCSLDRDSVDTHSEDRVSFRHPESWHVTGFSTTNAPRRLAVASYRLPEDAVEGDCGGYEAVGLLPRDGALVILLDYGSRVFPERPPELALEDGALAEYECFGRSTMFRFRVGDRGFQVHVALGAEAGEETWERALAILDSIEVDEPPRFTLPTRREDDRLVLPLTFPDGTSAELLYAGALDLAGFDVRPYGSARLRGRSPIPGRSDVVGRDFVIEYGDVEQVLASRNRGLTPARVAEYRDRSSGSVGLWDVRRAGTNVRYLGFQFGHWAVLVYDYAGAGGMTDAERATWVESFSGRETADGFLVLEADGPLRLVRAGEHAGPSLILAAAGPSDSFELFPGPCRPHRGQTRLMDGKLVQWNGGFADWCLSDSMRIHAAGDREFIGSLVKMLEVRNVELGTG